MDVAKYSDGEWLTIVVTSDKELDPFRFKVQPIGELAAMAAAKHADSVTSMCIDAVVDWNLTSGDEPLPCDEKTKRLYLSRFAIYEVKSVNGVEPTERLNIAAAIVQFATRPDNFLKPSRPI
jgi:hypothetical protein